MKLRSFLIVTAVLLATGHRDQLRAQCEAQSPLRVHVLFDNSSSVQDSLRNYSREAEDWFRRLFGILRPIDSVYVHPLLGSAGAVVQTRVYPVGFRAPATRAHQIVGITATLDSLSPHRTDLARSLQSLYNLVRPSSNDCHLMLLVVTDGALAPLVPGLTRDSAVQELVAAVSAWKRAGTVPLAVLVDSANSLAFDSYHWKADEDAEKDRHWRGMRGDALLAHAFGSFVGWRDEAALFKSVYSSSTAPMARHWEPALGAGVDLERVRTRYLLYRTSGDEPDEYSTCDPERITNTSTHFITPPAGRFTAQGWCYHHLLEPTPEVLRRVPRPDGHRLWAAESHLVLSVPDPLRNPSQLLVSDSGSKGLPTCTSAFARQALARGGWKPDWALPLVQVLVSSMNGRPAVDTFTLARIPGSTCYAPSGTAVRFNRTANADSIIVHAEQTDETETVLSSLPKHLGLLQEPLHAELHAKSILHFRALGVRVNLWVMQGRFVLTDSTRWRSVIVGAKRIALTSADLRPCHDPLPHTQCYEFRRVFNDTPPHLAFLTDSAGARSDGLVPLHIETSWNTAVLLMPWRIFACLLFVAIMVGIAGAWGREARRPLQADGTKIDAELKSVIQNFLYLGYFTFVCLFFLVEYVELYRIAQPDGGVAFIQVLAQAAFAIALAQSARLLPKLTPKKDP